MVKKRIVDNRNRPAQPEPGADPATKKTPVRKGVIRRGKAVATSSRRRGGGAGAGGR
jgi:hypothetical protein